jgi:hypothetical protein
MRSSDYVTEKRRLEQNRGLGLTYHQILRGQKTLAHAMQYITSEEKDTWWLLNSAMTQLRIIKREGCGVRKNYGHWCGRCMAYRDAGDVRGAA